MYLFIEKKKKTFSDKNVLHNAKEKREKIYTVNNNNMTRVFNTYTIIIIIIISIQIFWGLYFLNFVLF